MNRRSNRDAGKQIEPLPDLELADEQAEQTKGGAGDDRLIGGGGRDVLIGGAGADR